MDGNYKTGENYIQLVDKRNKNLAVNNLLGININIEFMSSVVNVTNTN